MRILSIFVVLLLISWMPKFAFAQEMGPKNQQLADKWMNSVFPDPIQSRKSGEEVLYNGDLVSEEEAARLLAADQQKPAQKLSELVDLKVFSSLQRQMKSKRLIGLIKAGKLVPNTYTVGEGQDDVAKEQSRIGVYLELHTFANPKPFAWGDVELIFDLRILDRADYIVSPYWDYGSFGPLAASAELSPGRVAYFFRTYLAQQEQNEVVFLNEIPFSALKQIVVKKGLKRRLLKEISAQKLNCPQQGGCSALIIER
jgi:hypothetical protein